MPLYALAMEHCPHRDNSGGRRAAHAASIENVPAAAAASPCPEHGNQASAIKAGVMPKCQMEGCCIKADAPLSSGLGNSRSASDAQALSVTIGPSQADGRQIGVMPYYWRPLRNRAEPEPRPPAACLLLA